MTADHPTGPVGSRITVVLHAGCSILQVAPSTARSDPFSHRHIDSGSKQDRACEGTYFWRGEGRRKEKLVRHRSLSRFASLIFLPPLRQLISRETPLLGSLPLLAHLMLEKNILTLEWAMTWSRCKQALPTELLHTQSPGWPLVPTSRARRTCIPTATRPNRIKISLVGTRRFRFESSRLRGRTSR